MASHIGTRKSRRFFPPGDRSPISLLSAYSSVPESSICDLESHKERTEGSINPSVPLNYDTEHERTTFEVDPWLIGQETIERLLESPSNLQKDIQDALNSTRSDNLQAEPHDTPDA